MVAGHGLVQQQGFHFMPGPGCPLERVGIEVAGPGTVGRARRILGGGSPLVWRDLANAVRHARKFGEQLGEFGIDALGDVPERRQHFFGRQRGKTRVRPQEFQKVRERSREARLTG